jgi:hypothetical protein
MILHIEADTLILDENRVRRAVCLSNDNKPTPMEHEASKKFAEELVKRWNYYEVATHPKAKP